MIIRTYHLIAGILGLCLWICCIIATSGPQGPHGCYDSGIWALVVVLGIICIVITICCTVAAFLAAFSVWMNPSVSKLCAVGFVVVAVVLVIMIILMAAVPVDNCWWNSGTYAFAFAIIGVLLAVPAAILLWLAAVNEPMTEVNNTIPK